MAKTLQYWHNRWNSYPSDTGNAAKVCMLLAEYSQRGYFLPGSVNRFLAMRWNTHHGQAVATTLAMFDKSSESVLYDLFTVTNVLSALKKNMNGQTINQGGDLSLILLTIREKTGVEYGDVDAQAHEKDLKNLREVNIVKINQRLNVPYS